MIGHLIWRNLWRNPRRTWITTASITFSVFLAIVMQSFQKGTYDNMISNVVNFYSGYVQVHKNGYWEDQVLDNCFEADDSLLVRLSTIPGITGFVPRIETFVLASMSTVTKGCLLVGTDPEKEDSLTHLREKITVGKYFKRDEEALVIAEGLAKRLNITAGDTLVLFGQGFHGTMAAGKYPVRGIVHLASPKLNDNMVYLPLAQAQYFLTAENRLTSLSIRLDEPAKMDQVNKDILAMLGEEYEAMTWEELMPEIGKYIKADVASSYVFIGILYLIIGFGFFGTIMMMTAERTHEFGMLIAIGMKKRILGLILLGESFLITLLGIFFGSWVSLPFVLYFVRHPIRFTGKTAEAYELFGFEAVMPAALHAPIFVNQSLVVLAIAFVVGFYPFWYVRRLNPVNAME